MNRALLIAAVAAATAVASPALGQARGSLSPSFLVGRWSDTRACRDLVEYRADGSYQTARGDRGRWTLEGSRLTMRARIVAMLNVQVVNRNEIEVRLVGSRASAAPGRSYRCRSEGRPAR